MRDIIFSTCAALGLLASASGAHGADMPVKAPVYKAPPAAIYDWSGVYAGGNIGYSWGRAATDTNISGYTVTGIFFDVDVPGAAFSDANRLNGIIGGAQIGYNVQAGQWVVGLELDWQASGEKGGTTRTNALAGFVGDPVADTTITGTDTTQYDARIRWFGTVRGRVGYATGDILPYLTGGLAYGRVQVSGTNTVTGVVTDCIIFAGCFDNPFNAVTSLNGSKVNLGWTLGAGIEGALASMSNWTWKLEYLYLDLGSLDVAAVVPGAAPSPVAVTTYTITTHTRFTDQVIRLGLNWRFGGAVVAKN
jgi:outer membrane immunogenic protein